MIDKQVILEALAPLPPRLRSRIISNLLTRMEEARETEKPQNQTEQEIVETILQEIFTNFIQPIEMAKYILTSQVLGKPESYRIEFQDFVFDSKFIVEMQNFREDFFAMIDELGFTERILSRGKQLKWDKQENGQK
jgi:hypothetical protein